MASGSTVAQAEVAALMRIRPGERVLEVGYGPGRLLQLLADRSEAQVIAGVDPSPVMRAQALRRCRAAVEAGRIACGIGTAAETGHPDQSFDDVVSVNNFLFWDDLPAGLRELHCVLRSGGSVTIAFHSRTSPLRHERRMGLPEDVAIETQTAMAAVFDKAARHDLTRVVAFTGVVARWLKN